MVATGHAIKVSTSTNISSSPLGAGRPSPVELQNATHPQLLRAIRNIAELGDTDVCPYPPEKQMFRLMEPEVLSALTELYENASDRLQIVPPVHETLMSQVGYTGFRWVTQLDPLWNAYFLGLCVSIGNQIEKARIPATEHTVFSYRYRFDDVTNHMFDPGVGWPEFIDRSRELATKYEFVVKCDIADFYHRVPHPGLEKALDSFGVDNDVVERIRGFLSTCSPVLGIGLPVGGPAARLLAEVILNKTDLVLRDMGIPFCRFADDYHLFASTLDSAYGRLMLLSELLQRHHGMTLQKLKTRILSQKEFLGSTGEAERSGDIDDKEIARFLAIKLRYDPYAPNARESRNRISEDINSFDILGMLSREMAKSRVNELVTRRLTRAIQFLSPSSRNAAIKKLIARERSAVLAPIFSTVLVLVRDIFDELPENAQEYVLGELYWLYEQTAPFMRLDINIAFWLRVLAKAKENQLVAARKQCVRLYDETKSRLVRRDAIFAIAELQGTSWLANVMSPPNERGIWERRALIAVSHLSAEGQGWRQATAPQFDEVDRLYEAWGALVQRDRGTFIS